MKLKFHQQIAEAPFNGRFVRNDFVNMHQFLKKILKEIDEIEANGGVIIEVTLRHDFHNIEKTRLPDAGSHGYQLTHLAGRSDA